MTNAWQIWAGTEIMIAIHPMAVWTLGSGAAWCNQCSGTCSAYDWYPVWLRYLAKDIMSEIQDVLTRTESPPSRQLWLWRREKMWRADDRAEASSASGLQRLLRNDRGQWRGHDSASFFKPSFWPCASSDNFVSQFGDHSYPFESNFFLQSETQKMAF